MGNENDKEKKLIKGGPFAISELNHIFAYTASVRDVAVLAQVCKLWNETQKYYAGDMWKTLINAKWQSPRPQNKNKNQNNNARFSRHSYIQRALTRIMDGRSLHEIENCASLNPDFTFVCPILAQNLKRTDEISTDNSLPILYCTECHLNVHPVTSERELKSAASMQRCVIIPPSAREAIRLSSNDDRVANPVTGTLTGEQFYGGDDFSLDHINVALVVTTTDDLVTTNTAGEAASQTDDAAGSTTSAAAPAADSYYSSARVENDTANDVLRRVAHIFEKDGGGGLFPQPSHPDNGAASSSSSSGPPPHPPPYLPRKLVAHFMSRDYVSLCYVDEHASTKYCISIRVVRVPPYFKNCRREEHPAVSDRYLGGGAMPSKGGWNVVAAATRNASMWFRDSSAFSATPCAALTMAGRLLMRHSTEQHIDSWSDEVALKIRDVVRERSMRNIPMPGMMMPTPLPPQPIPVVPIPSPPPPPGSPPPPPPSSKP